MQLQVPTYIHSRGRRKKYTFHSRFYYVGFLFLVKRSISVENRPRSGRFGSRSVEVGQVEKNRPTPNTMSDDVNGEGRIRNWFSETLLICI